MLTIQTIPCLSDNLSYLLINEIDHSCVAIDPGEARPFLSVIQSKRLNLIAVLATHHHYDHIGGLSEFNAVPVWSSLRDRDRIPGAGGGGLRKTLGDRQTVTWRELAGSLDTTAEKTDNRASEITITALEIPGHTQGQLAYVVNLQTDPSPSVFVGDTLFSLGCGRCLEGTPQQLFESLQKIKNLPPQSRIYFGHEYTQRNALFWLSLGAAESGNPSIDLTQIQNELFNANQNRGIRPAPTLESEMKLNPFLKTKNASEFSRWRDLRNQF